MEKPAAAKPKIKLLRFLPKAASAISLHHLPFSPRRNKKADVNKNKLTDSSLIVNNEFPGPVVSIMPAEATSQKLKSSSFAEREPTSPKVSCMGHIKHRKKCSKPRLFLLPNEINQCSAKLKASSAMKPAFLLPEAKKKQSGVKNVAKPGRKSDVSSHIISTAIDRAPSLSQMKQFASCRGSSLANFDWTKAQIESDDHMEKRRCYYSDEEIGDSDGDEEEEEDEDEEEVHFIPFFASCGQGGSLAVEPRKEINLWKRRTIDQPTPLQINTCIRIHR